VVSLEPGGREGDRQVSSSGQAICTPGPEYEWTDAGALLWRAPAKLNLALRVVGRREDGFHEIDSVVCKVSLYDELRLRPRRDGAVRLRCRGFECGPVRKNLVHRAAVLLRERFGGSGADIALTKRIRPGSGLGGGSSDAAATLKALDRLWELHLGHEELMGLAAELGSDVPLFLGGPAARIRGRGEAVQPVRVGDFRALVYMPELACRTAEVYAAWDAPVPARGGPAGGAIPQGLDGPPSRWEGGLFNDLRLPAERVCPRLASVGRELAAAVGRSIHLTGSGSALFVLFDDENEAGEALRRLPRGLRADCRLVCRNPW